MPIPMPLNVHLNVPLNEPLRVPLKVPLRAHPLSCALKRPKSHIALKGTFKRHSEGDAKGRFKG